MQLKRKIIVERVNLIPVEKQKIEIVERKGLGHPDSLCDGIAEAVSVALSREYEKTTGTILHHNTDKTLLIAGRSRPRYGGGEVISPIHIIVAGRATKKFDGTEIPVDTIAIKNTKEYLRKNIRNLNVEDEVVIDCRLGEGSSDLIEICRLKSEIPDANDTSFGVAHAPLSETERCVLEVERRAMLEYRSKEKALGEDMKVMGLRERDKIKLTVADAFVSRYIEDYDHYISIKDSFKEFAEGVAQEKTERDVEVTVNVADTPGSVYITVTGTSAEMGDDGCSGRGNRCNGLITPNRPISMEATCGKNPINHTGKIYNLLANMIANEVADKFEEIEEVYVKILSDIGKRIDDPRIANAQIVLKESAGSIAQREIERKTVRIIDDALSRIGEISRAVLRGELQMF